MYIDTHCHLSLEEDIQDVMKRCKEAKVNQIIISGCDFESIPESIKIAHDMQDIYLALGFHPETASEVTKKAPFPASGRRHEIVCARWTHFFHTRAPAKKPGHAATANKLSLYFTAFSPVCQFPGAKSPKLPEHFIPLAE